jgi:hypothetical protein
LWFNTWLRKPEIAPLVTEMSGLFASVYANVETGKAIIKDKKFYTPEGELFSIVHFNGGTKDTYHDILYGL